MYNLFSYIIPYRKSSSDREYALNFTINYLNKHFPDVEIIVVEQDNEPQEHNLTGNYRLEFTYNPGLFNRSWGMNCGAEASERPYVVFADNDVFMSPEDYQEFFQKILDSDADVVIPSGITITNPEYKKVRNIKLVEGESLAFIQELEERERWTYAMMLTLFKKEKLKSCGYWFEEFEGWGAEDNAMDELITRCLKYEILNLQLYHIDHARSVLDGNKQPNYELNTRILDNIKKQFSLDTEGYIKRRLVLNNIYGAGDFNKYKREQVEVRVDEIKSLLSQFNFDHNSTSKRLVLAITTFNRLNYLHAMLVSFLKNSNQAFNWSFIIADDGSEDDTRLYLDKLSEVSTNFHVIKNDRRGVAHQFNSIIQKLTTINFDLCFKCDDDILFVKKGWEKLYINAIDKTGYEHLCYYYTGWRSHVNFDEPKFLKNRLVSFCEPLEVQGAFFTITPAIVEKVGYMDAENFAPRGFEHVDYSIRCSRAGFNDKELIYDALGSNDYVWLNYDESYKSTVQINEYYSKLSPPQQVTLKKELMSDEERIYLPYNESPQSYDDKYMLSLANEIILDLKKDLQAQRTQLIRYQRSGVIVAETGDGHFSEEHIDNLVWQKKCLEVQEWYNAEYEVLPIWYKRVGHVIKVVSGKRKFKSLLE